jgi:hypothetical protein
MKFWLTANAFFEADDVDDAFLRLSQHFRDTYLRKEDQFFLSGSCIQIAKVNPSDDEPVT